MAYKTYNKKKAQRILTLLNASRNSTLKTLRDIKRSGEYWFFGINRSKEVSTSHKDDNQSAESKLDI